MNAPMTMLPPGKTVDDVLGDYFQYLQEATRDHIKAKHIGGADLWNELEREIIYVLRYARLTGSVV
jgi:hypothetical protein